MSTMTTAVTETKLEPQIRELSSGFGAELIGCDFSNGVSEERFRLIQDLVTKVSFSTLAPLIFYIL